MKAIVLEAHGGAEVLKIKDIPAPQPGPAEVLVRVHATAVNRADVLQRMGHYPQPGRPPKYEIPGLEFAGEVAEVGGNVDGWAQGDRVLGLLPGGGYAEYVAVPQRMLMRIPDALSFEEAASIPEVWFTAYDALFPQAGLQLGDWVLVHAGGSGVGTAATQLARTAGARVVSVVGSPEKAQRAAQLGANRVVNRHEEDFVAATQEATAGHGADVVLEFVGAPNIPRDLQATAEWGRVVVIGTLAGANAELPLGLLMGHRARILGTTLRSRPPEAKQTLTQRFATQALPLFQTGQLKPVVDRVFDLADAGAAHTHMEQNRNFGKIVLRVGA